MDLRKLMALMAAALLLSSCSNDEEREVSQPVPIRLTTTVSGESTRAADGINDTNFPYETPITVSVDGSNYNYKTDDDDVTEPMVCQDATPPYFPVSGSSVHIVAYYPSSVTYSTTAQTFTVKHDQSQTTTGTANYKASDLMVGLPKNDFKDDDNNTLIEGTGFARKVKYTTKTIPLEFEHRLAKIRIKCTTNGATVQKVEMKNIQRSIVYNSSDNTFGALSTATDDVDNTANTIIMYNDATTGSNTDFYCAAIIPIQSLAIGTEFITITTTSGVPLVYKLPNDLDPGETLHNFESGKQYNFNVNINDYELTVTSNITDWTDDTSISLGDGLAIRKKLPIEYVAPYNLQTPTTMATDNHVYHSMYLSWNNSTATSGGASGGPKSDIQDMINGTAVPGYHLPSRAEWCAVLAPYYTKNSSTIPDTNVDGDNEQTTPQRIHYGNTNGTSPNMNMKEIVGWGVKINNGTYSYDVYREFCNDYNCPTSATIGYALRFKELDGQNGEYTCAYRYQYQSSDANVGSASLTVNVKYVGANASVTISTISNEAWWSSPEYTIVLPTLGYFAYTSPGNKEAGSSSFNSAAHKDGGHYWAAEPRDGTYVDYVYFNSSYIQANSRTLPGRGFPIRLFKDAD